MSRVLLVLSLLLSCDIIIKTTCETFEICYIFKTNIHFWPFLFDLISFLKMHCFLILFVLCSITIYYITLFKKSIAPLTLKYNAMKCKIQNTGKIPVKKSMFFFFLLLPTNIFSFSFHLLAYSGQLLFQRADFNSLIHDFFLRQQRYSTKRFFFKYLIV